MGKYGQGVGCFYWACEADGIWYYLRLLRASQRYPTRRQSPADPVSRGTGHGASADHQELRALSPFLPWEHHGTAEQMGKWAR